MSDQNPYLPNDNKQKFMTLPSFWSDLSAAQLQLLLSSLSDNKILVFQIKKKLAEKESQYSSMPNVTKHDQIKMNHMQGQIYILKWLIDMPQQIQDELDNQSTQKQELEKDLQKQ